MSSRQSHGEIRPPDRFVYNSASEINDHLLTDDILEAQVNSPELRKYIRAHAILGSATNIDLDFHKRVSERLFRQRQDVDVHPNPAPVSQTGDVAEKTTSSEVTISNAPRTDVNAIQDSVLEEVVPALPTPPEDKSASFLALTPVHDKLQDLAAKTEFSASTIVSSFKEAAMTLITAFHDIALSGKTAKDKRWDDSHQTSFSLLLRLIQQINVRGAAKAELAGVAESIIANTFSHLVNIKTTRWPRSLYKLASSFDEPAPTAELVDLSRDVISFAQQGGFEDPRVANVVVKSAKLIRDMDPSKEANKNNSVVLFNEKKGTVRSDVPNNFQ